MHIETSEMMKNSENYLLFLLFQFTFYLNDLIRRNERKITSSFYFAQFERILSNH